ncbi:hypothetical protein ISCGN_032921 [Ixodes scapularis]
MLHEPPNAESNAEEVALSNHDDRQLRLLCTSPKMAAPTTKSENGVPILSRSSFSVSSSRHRLSTIASSHILGSCIEHNGCVRREPRDSARIENDEPAFGMDAIMAMPFAPGGSLRHL